MSWSRKLAGAGGVQRPGGNEVQDPDCPTWGCFGNNPVSAIEFSKSPWCDSSPEDIKACVPIWPVIVQSLLMELPSRLTKSGVLGRGLAVARFSFSSSCGHGRKQDITLGLRAERMDTTLGLRAERMESAGATLSVLSYHMVTIREVVQQAQPAA